MSRTITPTHVLLNQITLASASSSVTFSSISQSYCDLVLVFQGTSSTDDQLSMRFNSDSGNNYNWVQIGADPGSGLFTGAPANQNRVRIGLSSTSQGSHITQIMDYSTADKHKATLSRSNKAASDVRTITGRWANTAAITSIDVIQDGGNIAAGTTISLYGVYA